MGLTNTPSDFFPARLTAFVAGAKHGYGIVECLRLSSHDILRVGESARAEFDRMVDAIQRVLATT